MNNNNFEEFIKEWVNTEEDLNTVFSIYITDHDSRDDLYSTTIKKDRKHSDKIAFTVCIGDIEGNVPHMHIFRGYISKPSTVWDDLSIRLQFKRSQYFEKLKQKELTTKEIKTLVKGLKSKYKNTDHTVWEQLIAKWNELTKKTEGDEKNGWLDPRTEIPDYESGISPYR